MTETKFTDFVQIVKRLRKECPWDKEQTNDSIKANTIEEAYEVVEAIDNKNYDELRKELGDLLLHVVFHTQIAEEDNHFNIDDVIDSIQEKLIRRHPHVFGEVKVSDSNEVKRIGKKLNLAKEEIRFLTGFHLIYRLYNEHIAYRKKLQRLGLIGKRKKMFGKSD